MKKLLLGVAFGVQFFGYGQSFPIMQKTEKKELIIVTPNLHDSTCSFIVQRFKDSLSVPEPFRSTPGIVIMFLKDTCIYIRNNTCNRWIKINK